MSAVTIKVDGLAELRESIRKLEGAMRKRVLGAAVAAGALVVVKEAKKTTAFKDRSGDLRAAIKQRRSTRDSKQDFEVRHVGVFKNKTGRYAKTKRNVRLGRAGKEYTQDPPEYYWRFLEFGTVKMGPKSFLRPALQSSKQVAIDRIKQRCAQKLNEEVKKLNPVTNPRKR